MKQADRGQQDTASRRPEGGAAAVTLWYIVAAGAIAVPLFVARTNVDAFRLPKELLYEAIAAIAGAFLTILLLYRQEVRAQLRAHALPLAVAGAALLWTAITTLTSTNREISALSLVWVAAVAVMFVATLAVARRGRGLALLGVVFFSAAVNAGLAILQRSALYNPLYFPEHINSIRIQTTGLIGNPNDLGTYLLFPALAALAVAATSRNRARMAAFAVLSALLAAGLLASETLTAVAAYVAGVTCVVALRMRRFIVPFAAVALCAVLVFSVFGPLRRRVATVADHARAGRYVEVSSLRLPAFAVALEMFKARPLLGVGPGCFAWWYLPYKLELSARHVTFYATPDNFGEAHNDHLQTLAVSGVPGYLIFLAAVAALARQSFPRRGSEIAGPNEANQEREAFSRLAALPFAVAFAVVTLAQFPLELASSTSVMTHLAAVCFAWRET